MGRLERIENPHNPFDPFWVEHEWIERQLRTSGLLGEYPYRDSKGHLWAAEGYAVNSSIRDLVKFLFKFLQEQGVNAAEVVAQHAIDNALHPSQYRDLVGNLAELGVELPVPVMPEGKIVPGANNTTSPVTERPTPLDPDAAVAPVDVVPAAEPQGDGDDGSGADVEVV